MSLRRLTAFSFLLLALLVPASAAAQAGEADTQRVIAADTKAGGVDVGGQTIESAATNLELALSGQLGRTVVVKSAGRTFRLAPADAGFAFDALTTAKRAYYAGRDKGPGAAVALALEWRKAKVAGFVSRVDQKASIAAKDAWLEITVRKMIKHRAKSGRSVNEKALRTAIDAALLDPSRTRVLKPGRRTVRAKINANHLASQNPTVLTVDRSGYKLRLFKRLKLSKTYGIAVGAAGYDTPSGLYRIQNKQVNPAWHAPNRPWAGSYAGKTVPGGAPNNPLKARWLGIVGGVGIHGTGEPWSIGTRASHGCIRMRVPDVIDLYPRVPVGSRVLIR